MEDQIQSEVVNQVIAAFDPGILSNSESETQQIERFSVAMAPTSVNVKNRTIDAVWYAGSKVPRFDWSSGEEYDLTLSMDGCRMGRLNGGAPVLNSHNTYGVDGQLGVVRKAWSENGSGKATLQFSMRDAVTPVWEDVQAGIIQNLSAGMWIYSKRETTPDKQLRKEFLATDWEPFEISLVPVPADAKTMFMSAEVDRRASAQKETPMPDKQEAAGNEARSKEELDAARAAGRDEQRAFEKAIRLKSAPFKFKEEFVASLIDGCTTLEAAGERIIAELAARSEAHPINNAIATAAVTVDEHDKRRAGLEAAILFRANPRDSSARDAGREWAGLSLVEMAKECLNAAGVKTRGMSKSDVARVALQGRHGAAEYFEAGGQISTSDFPNILANVANKTLRQAYEAAPRTFVPFCRQVSAADFKPINRVQLSDVPTLPAVNENGEFHRTALSDSKETYKLATFGEIVSITRQVIVNDDLQALTRVPAGLGQAAANLESDTVWAVITANANLSDAVALFHATHANLKTGNGLAAVANITAARTLMRKQTGPKGTILNLVPKYLIVPAALEGIAVQLTNPINLAATASSADVPQFVRAMIPIVEPRLDAVVSVGATNWYTAADPSQIDTIEYCYLEGQQGVYIETRQGFEVDGVEIKARMDFAAAAIDYRGLEKNTA